MCKTCATCATRKNPSKRGRGPLQNVVAGYLMQIIAVDIVGPISPSTTGNAYMLVAVTEATKLVDNHRGNERFESCIWMNFYNSALKASHFAVWWGVHLPPPPPPPPQEINEPKLMNSMVDKMRVTEHLIFYTEGAFGIK